MEKDPGFSQQESTRNLISVPVLSHYYFDVSKTKLRRFRDILPSSTQLNSKLLIFYLQEKYILGFFLWLVNLKKIGKYWQHMPVKLKLRVGEYIRKPPSIYYQFYFGEDDCLYFAMYRREYLIRPRPHTKVANSKLFWNQS